MTSPDLSACARCHDAKGRSCCEADEGEWLATLTRADVARIAAHLRRPEAFFCEEEWLTVEEARTYELHRPLFAGYFRQGPKRLTLKTAQGACVLLDRAKGCVLPALARPTACRLYPFEPWPDGSFSVLAGGELPCLAVDESPDVPALQGALGLTPEALDSLAAQLREEVRDHGRPRSPRAP